MRCRVASLSLAVCFYLLFVLHAACDEFVPATRLWSAPVRLAPGAIPVPNGMAVANNGDVVLSIGKFSCRLYVLDGRTGKVRFARESRGFMFGTGISSDGRRIALMDYTGPQAPREVVEAQLSVLDAKGHVVWTRRAAGASRISRSGRYVLTFSVGAIAVYRGADGHLLWRAVLGQRSPVMDARFTDDERHILVNADSTAHMFSITGRKRWSVTGQEAISSLSTSRDGTVSAFVPESNTDGRFSLVKTRGQAVEVRQVRAGIPFAEGGYWGSVVIPDDGSSVVMAGFSHGAWEPQFPTGYFRLAGFDPAGRRLWTTPIGTPERANQLSVFQSPSSIVTVVAESDRSLLLYQVSSSGKLRRTLRVPMASGGICEFAANGRMLAVLSSVSLTLYRL